LGFSLRRRLIQSVTLDRLYSLALNLDSLSLNFLGNPLLAVEPLRLTNTFASRRAKLTTLLLTPL
jgi:hypothetical protein